MGRPDDPDAWEVSLARDGRLEIGYRRVRTGALAAVCLAFALGGALVALTGDSVGDRVLGILGLLVAGAVTTLLVRRLRSGAGVVVVTPTAVHSVPHGWSLPWPELRGAFSQTSRGHARVCLVVDPAWQEARLAGSGRADRMRAAGTRRLYGGLEVVVLPFPLAVDEEVFAAWLGSRASSPPGVPAD